MKASQVGSNRVAIALELVGRYGNPDSNGFEDRIQKLGSILIGQHDRENKLVLRGEKHQQTTSQTTGADESDTDSDVE